MFNRHYGLAVAFDPEGQSTQSVTTKKRMHCVEVSVSAYPVSQTILLIVLQQQTYHTHTLRFNF